MSNRRHNDIIDDLTRIYKGQRYSKGDFTDKLVDGMLAELVGIPGISGGRSQIQSSGSNTSAYTSAQSDSSWWSENKDTVGTIGSGLFGLIGSILGMAHADLAAKKSYERQNEFYDNHISMPAKVSEYQEAGLNPMGLAGAGVGATSSPGVDQAATPDIGSSLSGVLSTLLNYKLGMKEIDARNREIDVKKDDVASQIKYRAEQIYYQQKVNEWFDANQIASIGKMSAETQDALQRVKTGEADELLKFAGVEKTQAESCLIFQEEMQKLWQNSPEWREVELQLKRAHTQSYQGDAAHAYADLERISAETNNLQKDAALKVANTEIGRQQLKNLGLTEQQIQWDLDHNQGNLIWDRVGKVAGALKDVGIGVGAAISPVKIGSIGSGGDKVYIPPINNGNSTYNRSSSGAFTTEGMPRGPMPH